MWGDLAERNPAIGPCDSSIDDVICHHRHSRITLVLYRRRAFTTKLEVRRAMWRAFDAAVRRKPLAGAADAVYGNSIDFGLEVIARIGVA